MAPTGFFIASPTYLLENVIVTFQWDEVQSNGRPETVIDNYMIYIFNSSSHLVSNATTDGVSLNITLEYNVEYEANLTAINCVGESPAVRSPSFLTSKVDKMHLTKNDVFFLQLTVGHP